MARSRKKKQPISEARGKEATIRRLLTRLLVAPKQRVSTLDEIRKQSWEIHRGLFESAATIPGATRILVGDAFPREVSTLGAVDLPLTAARNPSPLEHELEYALSVLRYYEAHIRAFLLQKAEFDRLTAGERWQEAERLLQAITHEFGYSLWQFEAELLVANRLADVRGNRMRMNEIISASRSQFVHAFAITSSLRAERQMTPELLDRELERLLAISELEKTAPPIAFHLRFHANYQTLSDWSDGLLSLNLRYSHRYSVIDRLQAFIRTLQVLVARKEAYGRPKALSSLAARTARLFDEPRIRAVATIVSGTHAPSQTKPEAALKSAIESYTLGDYAATASITRQLILDSPDLFDAYELHVKSLLRQGQSADIKLPQQEICAAIRALELREPGMLEAVSVLRARACAYDNCAFGGRLLGHIAIRAPHLFALEGRRLAAVNATILTPRDTLSARDAETAEILLRGLEADGGFPVTTSLFRSVSVGDMGLPPELPEDRALKYKATAAELRGDLALAATEWTDLAAQAAVPAAVRRAALESLYRVEYTRGRLAQCAEIVIRRLFEGDELFFREEIPRLLEADRVSPDETLRSSLAWPLLHFIQLRGVISNRDAHRVYASLDQFLTLNELKRPSDIRDHINSFDHGQLVTLLRFICIPEILDWSLEYASPEEVSAERTAILELLEEIDPAAASDYQEERTEIARKNVVQKGLEEVDRAKIYVDVNGIRQSMPTAFQESVKRYLGFRSIKETLSDLVTPFAKDDSGVFVVRFNKEGRLESADPLQYFVTHFNEVLARFLRSDEYGLDASLSMEVRHGTLAGQLRGPFEHALLITKRDSDNQYAPNTHWLELSEGIAPESVGKLHDILGGFSRTIDGIIEHVKEQLIQIRDAERPHGLFEYDYDEVELVALRDRADAATTVDSFIAIIFDELWQRTRRNLERVRAAINGEVAEGMDGALGALQRDVMTTAPALLAELSQRVADCRRELHAELQVITEWFVVNEASAMSDYDLGILWETTLLQTRRIPGAETFEPTLSLPSDITLQGRTFRPLGNLLGLMLHNVVKHAGPLRDTAAVAIEVTDGRLTIVIRNEVPPEGLPELRASLRELEERAMGGGSGGGVRQEGKSGFYKLGKLLKYDLKRRQYRVRTELDDNRFGVTIECEVEGLTA